VNQPSFPAAEFVQNTMALELALHESWCAKTNEEIAREKEEDKADLEKLGEQPTEADRKRYLRRVWIRLLRDCKKISEEEPHEIFTTGSALVRVIEALGVELLPAADILREMLLTKHQAYLASNAIGRMGRNGLEFYDDLLAGLKRDDPNFACSRALGAVLKAAPEKIPEVLRLACESRGGEQVAAISAIATCGRAATEAFPEVEVQLRAILNANPDGVLWYQTVVALGKCGRTSETVNCLLSHLDSDDPGRKGEIMLALGDVALEPGLIVPRLIELLDTFQEYDPDWCYQGGHERVVHALRGFGRHAVSAVPALIRHVWTTPQKFRTEGKLVERPAPDEEVIKLLGEFGPFAKEALPALLEVRDEMRKWDSGANVSPEAGAGAADDEDTYWDVAIKRIQGDS
jgi:hypothetical protein